jgi:ubiquinone/menaquinone biosynthesis C-methylase UbiE
MSIPKALAEWHRLLKPGGVVAFSTMRTGSPQAGQLFRDCAKRFAITLQDRNRELGSADRCRLALETSGFRKLEILQEQIELSTLDLAHAWESNFRSAKHYAVRQLSPLDQKSLRQQYELALKEAQIHDACAVSRADVFYAFGRK